ncbi:protease inhibitor I42 family protein [Brevibacillus sp. TJ4]|uniref:protease inhibitor I42 family protein n=1 Tax=Brevibacillus sp. TJ4 TaxID=3234853 RepID=UPI0037D2ACDA
MICRDKQPLLHAGKKMCERKTNSRSSCQRLFHYPSIALPSRKQNFSADISYDKYTDNKRKGDTTMASTAIHAVTVRAGQIFSLSLESNPSTGYQWELSNPLDPRYLGLLSRAYSPPAPLFASDKAGIRCLRCTRSSKE